MLAGNLQLGILKDPSRERFVVDFGGEISFVESVTVSVFQRISAFQMKQLLQCTRPPVAQDVYAAALPRYLRLQQQLLDGFQGGDSKRARN